MNREDKAEGYARMKVKELWEKHRFVANYLIEEAIVDAVRYGMALGPSKEPEPEPQNHPNSNWRPNMGGPFIR